MIDGKIALEALDATRDGVVISDATKDGMPTIYVNNAFVEITGYSKKYALGKNCRYLQNSESDQAGLDIIRHAIENKTSCIARVRNYTKKGTMFWNELSLSPIFDNEKLLYYVGIQKDITDLVEKEERILFLATHDDLTALYNRRGFYAEAAKLLNLANRVDQYLVVALLDLDKLKKINDYFGHEAGDEIIQAFSKSLMDTFRTVDIISRLGGDEFGICMLSRTSKSNFFDDKIQQVIEATKKSCKKYAEDFDVSYGFYSRPKIEKPPIQDMLRHADRLMYNMKQQKKLSK